jgi:hypothetical protein
VPAGSIRLEGYRRNNRNEPDLKVRLMAANRILCPECGAPVRSADPFVEGQRVRCPDCRAVFTPDDLAESPARSRASGRNREQTGKGNLLPVLLIGGLVGGALLLGCAGVGIYFLVGRGGSDTPGGSTPVTQADLDKVEAYMSLAEVEGLLGKGRSIRYHEIGVMPAGGDDPNRIWYAWGPGDDSLVVGFEPGSSGTQRVVVSFLLQKSSAGGAFQQISTPGVVTARFPGEDLDALARDKEAQRKKLESPRWAKGAAIRKELIGTWVAFGVGAYEFKEDETCLGSQPGGKSSGTYRFLDNENIEMTLQDAPLFPGQQVRSRTLKYKVLVDKDELMLVDSRFRSHPTTYKRQK